MKILLIFVVLLPMLLSSAVASEPQPFVADAPAGITVHLTQSGLYVDANGTVFAKTRASSDIGDVVWTVDADGHTPQIVLQPGPEQGRGNGYIGVFRGVCSLITADDSNHIQAIPIPGCEAP